MKWLKKLFRRAIDLIKDVNSLISFSIFVLGLLAFIGVPAGWATGLLSRSTPYLTFFVATVASIFTLGVIISLYLRLQRAETRNRVLEKAGVS